MTQPAALSCTGSPPRWLQPLVILVFLLWPLGALPLILIEIWNRRPYAFVLLALFMGLCAVLMAPVTDLHRHTMLYFGYRDWPASVPEGLDVVLPALSLFFARTGIHFEIVRFLFVTASFGMYMYLFRDITARNETLSDDNRWHFLAFVTVFASIRFFQLTLGLRYGMAADLVICGGYLLLVQRRWTGLLFLGFAPLLHFSMVMFAAAVLGAWLIPPRLCNKLLLVALFVAGSLLSGLLMKYLVSALAFNEELQRSAGIYVEGAWGEAYDELRTLRGRIYYTIRQAPLIPLAIAFLWEKRKTALSSLIFLLIVILGIFLSFFILRDRVFTVLLPVMLLWFLLHFDTSRRYLRLFGWTAALFGLILVADLYSNRDYLAVSRFDKLLYLPAPAILYHSYSKQWVEEHIDREGYPRGVVH